MTMLTIIILLLFGLVFVPGILFLRTHFFSCNSSTRLGALQNWELEHQQKELSGQQEMSFPKTGLITNLSDSLGRAGFFTSEQRRRAKRLLLLMLIGETLMAAIAGNISSGITGLFIGVPFGLLFGTLTCVAYLRLAEKEFQREIIFQLPLTLEAIVFLVESGLGVLPALSKIISQKEEVRRSSPVKQIFNVVYELTVHGMPLSQALQVVADTSNLRILRHVLLHLDMSATLGGELVPALRSLVEHAITEWRLSVDRRVKRLENLVVFPVFTAVLGLGLLTAAVPLTSLLQLGDTLNYQQQVNVAEGSYHGEP